MLGTRHHLRKLLFFLSFTVLSGLQSVQAQIAETMASPTPLSSPSESNDSILARRAIAALEHLGANVLTHQSYGEFESDGRLARIPLETFSHKLDEVTREVQSILAELSDGKLKNHLSNSLYSYRDGTFWWARLEPQKVIKVETLRAAFATTTSTERFFSSTVPYTVVIHWRQAHKYLVRARKLLSEGKSGSLHSPSLHSDSSH